MTINLADNTPRIEYSVAQGVTQTTFAVPFEFFDNADLTVYVDGVEKTEGSDYAVIGGDGSTGQVLMSVTGGTGGSTVVLVRDIPIERTTDFTSNAINRAALNTQLDTIIGMIADLDDKASRTLQISDYEVAPDLSLPSVDARKGATLAFNESTGAVEVGPTIAATNTVANIAADISAVAANNADVSTVATNIVGVSGIAANLDEILLADDSAAAAAASATASANSAIASSGYASASSGYADAALLSMNTAIAAKNAAETAETNAAASATAAASSEAGVAADALAATNAASAAAASQTSAAASAATATTKASEAEGFRNDSATNAATSSAAATNAQLSATNAAASATAAASSASLADSEAAAADASASAALTSATNASESASTATQQAALAAVSAASAATSATAAAASATSASNDKLAAEAAATSATNTAAALTGFDLEAIAASKAVTAVDVFVYDTSKDSDGGAWRKRTQHTSWYNETLNTATRGSRREFPAVAVIVAESNKVTIYDGDDPALPMWIVFNGAVSHSIFLGYSSPGGFSVTMRDGHFCVGITGISTNGSINGLAVANFVADTLSKYDEIGFAKSSQGIADRNDNAWLSSLGWWSIAKDTTKKIVNQYVNDVSLTVLPDAPIDPATGLPVPTIAVATAGGVSVIKDDGAVVDSASTLTFGRVDTDDEGVWYWRNVATYSLFFASWGDVISGDGFGDFVADTNAGNRGFDLLTRGDTLVSLADGLALGGKGEHLEAVIGLMLHQPNYIDQTKGMSSLTTSTYNTGWLPGDIKGAFLADTDDTDLVGSGELVTNGTFDTDVSGWTTFGGGTSIAFSSGSAVATSDGSYNVAYQAITTVAGARYVISLSATQGTSNGRVRVGTTVGGVEIIQQTNLNGVYLFSFIATGTTTYVTLATAAASGDVTFDNISVKLADADRSVNNNGLIVNGTVTRSPVATGAELVAYSGFSTSNYLEQPYNSALDFGTGDFCVMGWVKGTDAAGKLFVRHDGTSSTDRIIIDVASGGYFRFYVDVASGLVTSTTLATTNTWTFVVGVRVGTTLYLYVNGALNASVSNAVNGYDLSNANAVINIGEHPDLSDPYGGSLALWRISATAPTAEQIKKIYEDEKVLFQENAAATLYGTSDAVTALAHDDATDLLHVGTSAGRSVFQGLRRVSNTTTAVGTAISAANNLVVEE